MTRTNQPPQGGRYASLLSLSLLATIATLGTTAASHAGGPANDDCANATPIAGNGLFNFDLTSATTGQNGQFSQCAPDGMRNDVWFCWTAPCTGLVTISTCGLTLVDTRIALFDNGCVCPAFDEQPLCCNDNACQGKQSAFTCEVVCCQTYLIQIAGAPGALLGPGQIQIDCAGEPCPTFPCDGGGTGNPPVCDPCCGGQPSFTGFPGQIALATQHRYTANEPVLVAFDLSGPGLNAPGTLSTPATYSHPSWVLSNLGTIFGVTFDDSGNAYVAHTTSFYFDALGSGGAGAVYKIDTASGAASVFAQLPNSAIAGCVGTECYPGLGNLCFDCGSRNFYVSNFEDGRIYRLDLGGNTLSTFDFATGAIVAGGAPEPGDANGFAPLGQRVWGVQASGGRLYFGVWVEDQGRPDAAAANQVWSIALTGTGEFVGAASLEITLPGFQGNDWSNPVSDLTFNENCCLVLAERSMGDDSTPNAHASRLLEFCFDAAAAGWAPSGNTFSVGATGLENSSSGGVDLDFSPGGLLWGTGDALQFSPDVIYGMAGLPPTGGNNASALLVDLDGEVTQQDKTQLGDVEIPCPENCLVISKSQIKCELENGIPTGNYVWSFTLTNNSGVTAQYALFTDPAVSPNVVPLIPALPDGFSTTITVTLSGLDPTLTNYCVDLILADAHFEACCADQICTELPDCDCMLVQVGEVICLPGTGGSFTFSFNYLPLAFNAEYMFIVPPLPPDPNSGITISPSFLDISTPQYTGGVSGPITVSGAVPGSELCLKVTIHAENLHECCSVDVCFTVPGCTGDSCPGDVNGDGVVDGADLGLLLSEWGGPGNGDLNGDGVVDGADLGLMLAAWGICA